MTRYGVMIRLRPEFESEYCLAHGAVPEPVLRTIERCNIRNYSIFLRDSILFGYFEYAGSDFTADMAAMAADPATQEWWSRMEPMQDPLPNCEPGEWWASMREVFHID